MKFHDGCIRIPLYAIRMKTSLYSLGVSQCTPVHSCAMWRSTYFRLWFV